MSHIEFIGPPGSGKTTLYQSLLSDDSLYGGVSEKITEGALVRSLQSQGGKRGLLARTTPTLFRIGYLRRIFEAEFMDTSFTTFVGENPTYLREMYRLTEEVKHEPERVLGYAKRAATQYQAGLSTVTPEERLCYDELFLMLAGAVAWRSEGCALPSKEFFEVIPTPKTVVHVDAPVETCLKRQQARGSVVISKPWVSDEHEAQQQFRDIHDQIAKIMDDSGVTVIRVENIGSVSDAIQQIRTALLPP